MHYHHESGDSQTKKLPIAETVTFLSDVKDKEQEEDRIDQYYSKSDDVFNDYYSSNNVQEQWTIVYGSWKITVSWLICTMKPHGWTRHGMYDKDQV